MTIIHAINLLKGLEQSIDDYCELNDEGKTAFRMAITALELFGISEQLPSAQPEAKTNANGDWVILNKDKILKAGMEGREVDFRIGGRLFAIREKAQ